MEGAPPDSMAGDECDRQGQQIWMDLMQNYCVLIRAHLRGLGGPIFQAKSVMEVLITVSKYQVHSCFSVRDIQG